MKTCDLLGVTPILTMWQDHQDFAGGYNDKCDYSPAERGINLSYVCSIGNEEIRIYFLDNGLIEIRIQDM